MKKSNIIELKNRLSHIIPIEFVDIDKLYEELISFFSDTQEKFITKRHRELQNEGYKNKDIYIILIGEIKHHLFKGKDLSERQVKRIIYGD